MSDMSSDEFSMQRCEGSHGGEDVLPVCVCFDVDTAGYFQCGSPLRSDK